MEGQIWKEGEPHLDANKGQDGERERAVTALVERYQTGLRRVCYAILKDEEAANDAVQETFLKAYRAMDSLRGEGSEKAWLTRIAVNTCRDMRRTAWFRRVDRRVEIEDLPLASEAPSEENAELALAILRLPRKLREAVLLYYYQDLTLRETAQALGVSTATASKRIRSAHARLRDLLEGRDSRE